jgi:hypothetical protein
VCCRSSAKRKGEGGIVLFERISQSSIGIEAPPS